MSLRTLTRSTSVFGLTASQMAALTNTRLLAQNTNEGRWGCASVTGFLAKHESLLGVARADLVTLQSRSVTYPTIAKRLVDVTRAAVQALGKPSTKPVLIENGKFQVTVEGPWMGAQYCPFSAENEEEATFSTTHECPHGNLDYTIRNMHTKQEISFSSLLPHLIGNHHFFLGHVKHRLDPVQVIETLELPREMNPVFPTLPPGKSWTFVGKYPILSCNLEEMIKFKDVKKEMLAEGLVYIELPYAFDVFSNTISANEDPRQTEVWSHFLNLTDQNIRIDAIVSDAPLGVTIPSHTHVILQCKALT